MKRSVAQAEHIFTVSKSTKNDIIKQFGSSANTISIASPSSSFEQFRDIQSKNNHKRKGYFLFVGERRKHKNIINIIKAFSLFTIKSKSHIDFFMVGRDYDRRYTELIKTTIGKLRLGKRIFLLKDIDSQKLVSLYKKSLALIFVSYYEGFGIPILEAMSFGIPVITSNVYSMPEVGGKAVLQVSPENIQDIANKMQSLITDDELRKKMIKSGKTQSRKFSWLKSARIISEFLNNHAY